MSLFDEFPCEELMRVIEEIYDKVSDIVGYMEQLDCDSLDLDYTVESIKVEADGLVSEGRRLADMCGDWSFTEELYRAESELDNAYSEFYRVWEDLKYRCGEEEYE